jgi:integrase
VIFKRGKIYYYEFELRGRRYKESTRQGNPRTARQLEAARRTQILKGEVGIRDKKPAMTLQQFADTSFKPHVECTFAAKFKTLEYYRNGLKNLMAFAELAGKPLDEIKSEAITAYAKRRQEAGVKISTVNRELQVLRRMFHLAAEWGKTEKILPKVRMLPGEKHRDRVISRGEEMQYLVAAPRLLKDVATILLDCGLRPEECFRLRIENVRDGAIHINYGKTRASRRRIPMTVRVTAIVEGRITSERAVIEEILKSKNVTDTQRQKEIESRGWLFPAPTRSGHMEGSSVKRQQAKVFSLTKIKPFELYCLRHTCLTRWAPKMDPFTLAYLAGHSDISITKRYVHPEDETVRAAMERAVADISSPTTSPTTQIESIQEVPAVLAASC